MKKHGKHREDHSQSGLMLRLLMIRRERLPNSHPPTLVPPRLFWRDTAPPQDHWQAGLSCRSNRETLLRHLRLKGITRSRDRSGCKKPTLVNSLFKRASIAEVGSYGRQPLHVAICGPRKNNPRVLRPGGLSKTTCFTSTEFAARAFRNDLKWPSSKSR